ncbi:MAG: sulfotransferase [Phycisphaerae bacterium]|nr:sulfotransferase [Phycisphaerae bacterium]
MRTPKDIIAAAHAGNAAAAREGIRRLETSRPRDLVTWLCAAEVYAALGCFGEMAPAIDRAEKLGGSVQVTSLMRAIAELGCGRVREGLEFARRAVVGLEGDQLLEAQLTLSEALYLANENDELAALLDRSPRLAEVPRGMLYRARVERRRGDIARADATLKAVFESVAPLATRRAAGFERVRLLDASGRYDEAFDAAVATHAATSVRFDVGGMISEIDRCASIASRGGFRMRSKPSRTVTRTALFASLPRSGTTLLEQMLDRHPGVSGLGELPAVETIVQGLVSLGGWPDAIATADTAALDRLQREYLTFVRSISKAPSDVLTLDKTIHTWHRLPAIAAVLPGAKLLRLLRDPRDNAISIFLSNFHRESMGWNASLDQIRQVIEAERRSVPTIARALEMDLLDIDYEALVRAPEEHLRRILDFLGLPWDARCARPHENDRVVITLSHEQVRRAINDSSIGRWRNYANRFDARWDALAR